MTTDAPKPWFPPTSGEILYRCERGHDTPIIFEEGSIHLIEPWIYCLFRDADYVDEDGDDIQCLLRADRVRR